ncbi:transposase [Haloimpatiens sp. FM7330]|uniref:transposase n=1 Tax=Haloimpatiens sp. FM7330 TaxID=3298610 RepID=UPI00362D7CD5
MRHDRIKPPKAKHHVICRGITEIDLFKDDSDKERFLSNLRKVKQIFGIKIYAYCLMDTHLHLLIDTDKHDHDGKGADISKVMHSLNLRYAMYYNKKYDRHGSVFSDRFKNIVIKDDRYLLCVSAYIHNNPKDISNYKNKVEDYKYSSLGSYLRKSNPYSDLVDCDFILKHFSNDAVKASVSYFELVKSRTNSTLTKEELTELESEMELKNIPFKYVDEKHILVKNYSPKKVVKFASNYLHVDPCSLNLKFNHKCSELRCICALLLRNLCNYKCKEICYLLGNICNSSVSSLCNKGYILISTKYKNIIPDLIKSTNVA